jgi:hypothetical protein
LADTVNDDAIVVNDFQQLAGFRLAIGSTCGVGVDRKSLDIKRLEMVDQTGASWNRIVSWLRQIEALRPSLTSYG